MNWDRAKTMLIICLLGLNAFLAAMYFIYEDDYVILPEDVSVVVEILASNGVFLEQADVPRRHLPVDQLLLRPAGYNINQLLDAFFIDTFGVSQTFEFGDIIFTSPEGTLTVTLHAVIFEPSPNIRNMFTFSEENQPYELAEFERYIRSYPQLFPDYVFDAQRFNNGWVYEFRQSYMGYTILTNELSFTVRDNSVSEVRYVHYPPKGFVGVQQPIISAPQALFLFMLNRAHSAKPIYITRIDIVHDLISAEDASESLTTAPYYRVFSESGDSGSYTDEHPPALINAVTGDAK